MTRHVCTARCVGSRSLESCLPRGRGHGGSPGRRRPRESCVMGEQGSVAAGSGALGSRGEGGSATAGCDRCLGPRAPRELTLGPPGWADCAAADEHVDNPGHLLDWGQGPRKWPFPGAPRGPRGVVGAPGRVPGAREGAGAHGRPQTGGTALGGAAQLPPSRPCPAAGRSGRLPSSRPCEAKCLDHPASSRSPAGPLLFSFGGARAGPGRRRRALGAACPAHVLRPARWLDSGASFPGEHGGPAGAAGSAGSGGGSFSSSVPTRRCTSCWGAGGPCSPSARGSGRARVPHSPWGLRRPGGPPPGVRELSLEAVRGPFSSSLGTRLRVLCLLLPLFSLSGGGSAPLPGWAWVSAPKGERPLSARSAALALLVQHGGSSTGPGGRAARGPLSSVSAALGCRPPWPWKEGPGLPGRLGGAGP